MQTTEKLIKKQCFFADGLWFTIITTAAAVDAAGQDKETDKRSISMWNAEYDDDDSSCHIIGKRVIRLKAWADYWIRKREREREEKLVVK